VVDESRFDEAAELTGDGARRRPHAPGELVRPELAAVRERVEDGERASESRDPLL
jgi:hypothetical protein